MLKWIIIKIKIWPVHITLLFLFLNKNNLLLHYNTLNPLLILFKINLTQSPNHKNYSLKLLKYSTPKPIIWPHLIIPKPSSMNHKKALSITQDLHLIFNHPKKLKEFMDNHPLVKKLKNSNYPFFILINSLKNLKLKIMKTYSEN
jgi:hypothetical protein